ncbi:unnamed protein product [Trichobilharzia szidati]|nr:unnamed protein product [Trichobilharzia szidati]
MYHTTTMFKILSSIILYSTLLIHLMEGRLNNNNNNNMKKTAHGIDGSILLELLHTMTKTQKTSDTGNFAYSWGNKKTLLTSNDDNFDDWINYLNIFKQLINYFKIMNQMLAWILLCSYYLSITVITLLMIKLIRKLLCLIFNSIQN